MKLHNMRIACYPLMLLLLLLIPAQLFAAGGNWGAVIWGAGEWTSSTDFDGDGIVNGSDNCPSIANPLQLDANNNGLGNACDTASDTDGDGMTDAEEFILGTDPLVPEYPLKVLTPNGDETLISGTTATLSWQEETGADHYTVRLSINGGASFWTLATGVAGTSYDWAVDNISTSSAVLRLVAYDAGGGWLAADDSDNPFTLVRYDTLLAPNGGQEYLGGQQVEVRWGQHPNAASYKVRISVDGGIKFWTLAENLTGSSAMVTMPNLSSDQVLIKVVGYSAGGGWLFADDSDATLSLIKGGTVLTPNGGEGLQPGQTLNVTWAAHAQADHYNVRFSVDGGLSFWTIGSNLTTNSFSWTLPNWLNHADCKVLVQTYNAGGTWIAADQSDAAFAVLKP